MFKVLTTNEINRSFTAFEINPDGEPVNKEHLTGETELVEWLDRNERAGKIFAKVTRDDNQVTVIYGFNGEQWEVVRKYREA